MGQGFHGFLWIYQMCSPVRPQQAWGCCLMSDQGQKLRSDINQGIFPLGLVKEGNPCQFSAPSYLPSMLRIHISSSSKKWLGQPRVSMSLNPSQGTCQSRQGVMHSTTDPPTASETASKTNLSCFLKFTEDLKNVLLPQYSQSVLMDLLFHREPQEHPTAISAKFYSI